MCLYAVTRRWFNSARISSHIFFSPFSLLICRSHCALWSFSRWQPSQVRAVPRIMFCSRLYTQASLWRMSLLEKFYIPIWQHITTATLTILWFVATREWIASLTQWHFFPPRLATKWVDLNFVQKRDMWWQCRAIPSIKEMLYSPQICSKTSQSFPGSADSN